MADTLIYGQAYRVCTDASTESFDKLSMWTDARDVDTNPSGNTVALNNQIAYIEGTLAANATTVRIPASGTSSLITADGMLDIYVPSDKSSLVPTTIDQNEGYVTLTFPAQLTATTIRVRCWK